MLCTFTSVVLGHAGYAILFFGGFPWPTLHAVIPEGIQAVGAFGHFTGIYLRGPSFNGSFWQNSIVLAMTPCMAFMTVSPFVGPSQYIPFGDPVIAAVGITVSVFFMTLAGSLGGSISTTAEAARKGLHMALAQSALNTLNAMNSLTDFRIVRVLLSRVCSLPRSPEPCLRCDSLSLIICSHL